MSRIAQNITKYRKAANMSKSQLADKLGVARSNITRWETGTAPLCDFVVPICLALGITPNRLFGFEAKWNFEVKLPDGQNIEINGTRIEPV